MEKKKQLNEKELENVTGGWKYVDIEITLDDGGKPKPESLSESSEKK